MRTSRRRVAGRVGGALAVAVAVLGTVSATSSASRTDGNQYGKQVLRFDLRFRDSVVDVGEPGFTVGDPIVVDDQVLGAHGRALGVQAGTCTITALLAGGHFRTYCTGAIRLEHGQIAFQGTVTDAPRKTLAITGGTDRYDGASGRLVVVELGHDDAGTLAVHLDK